MAQKPIRLEDDMYEATAHIAKLEHRSHANQVNMMLTLALGFYDELLEMDRKEKRMVRDHIVKEGRELGILPTPKIEEVKDFVSRGQAAQAAVDDLITPEKNASEANASGELVCCKNETQPCKHWVWDTQTGEGYRNVLSGRLLEVD